MSLAIWKTHEKAITYKETASTFKKSLFNSRSSTSNGPLVVLPLSSVSCGLKQHERKSRLYERLSAKH